MLNIDWKAVQGNVIAWVKANGLALAIGFATGAVVL